MTDRDDIDLLERQLGALARDITPADRDLVSPPTDLWAGIDGALEPPEEAEILPFIRRPRLQASVLAVAAVLVIALIGAGLLVATTGEDSTELAADAVLVNEDADGQPLPVASDDVAEASLIDSDGTWELAVDVPDLPAADGFYELWMIDFEDGSIQSLGEISGSGVYPVPSGVDPGTHRTVDVSVEAHDGDPTHGGQSIWRGDLEAV